MIIRTRFAPSPTGFLHIGSARTLLFAYAYAKKYHGKIILRIEDTDVLRSTKKSIDSILDAINWLNLSFDEGPFYQSQRFALYEKIALDLVESGNAYYCYCSQNELEELRKSQIANNKKPKYNRKCLHNKPDNITNIKPVIRFKNPTSGNVVWHDLVKGQISVNNEELDDLIILRSDNTPTYNFCVVVDDIDMQISHVIRGDDHINNTPRQINIYKALNKQIPEFAHLPMILRDDGQKMSKRNDAVSVMDYKQMGILPEALLNYLARLCWGHKDDEIFTLVQFIDWFELKNISPSPARFDIKKLFWVNSQHIKTTDSLVLLEFIKSNLNTNTLNIDLLKIINLIKPRHDNLNSLLEECKYFYNPLVPSQEEILQYLNEESIQILKKFNTELSSQDNWNIELIRTLLKEFCQKNNFKMPQLAMPLRLKLCGTIKTPAIDEVLNILGKDEVFRRLNNES